MCSPNGCAKLGCLAGGGHVVSHVTRLTICLPCYSSCAVTAHILSMEKNPWWRNVSGPFPKWEGPVGCKADGGGCHRGRGKVGEMRVHRAVHNKDIAGILHPFGVTSNRIAGKQFDGYLLTCHSLLTSNLTRMVRCLQRSRGF